MAIRTLAWLNRTCMPLPGFQVKSNERAHVLDKGGGCFPFANPEPFREITISLAGTREWIIREVQNRSDEI